MLRKNSDEFEELSKGGLLLGALETLMPYEQTDIQLNPGDLLVCYTDGVDEALNPAGNDDYGVDRLKDRILQLRDKSSKQIIEGIVDDVNDFSNNTLIDDLTLLVIKAV
jgi:sigma-B regulation protein RsbU (phosphoserine phosphatase)